MGESRNKEEGKVVMLEIKGKYTTANVMIDEIDDATRSQIQTFVNQPMFKGSYIAVMPDCHAGKGAVVGFTALLNDYVIPNVVGVDQGCGMLMTEFCCDHIDLEAFDKHIKENIPSGFSKRKEALVLAGKPTFQDLCLKHGFDFERLKLSLGTLGGGNHFIEAGVNSKGNICVTIHSGSRGFGLEVATYFHKKALDGMRKHFSSNEIPEDLAFFEKDDVGFGDYLYALDRAQFFAHQNRVAMMALIGQFADLKKNVVHSYESVHNFIDEEDKIIRKGATPAREGQVVIIPFNMRDGIAIGVGKGSKKYNYSAPHGAGRILSRSAAKKILNVDEFVLQMQEAGVYTTTAGKETLDEAPGAYKDKDVILENIKETVEITDFIKPIYNFKAGGE